MYTIAIISARLHLYRNIIMDSFYRHHFISCTSYGFYHSHSIRGVIYDLITGIRDHTEVNQALIVSLGK